MPSEDATIQVRHLWDTRDWGTADEAKRQEIWDLAAEWADHYRTLLQAKGFQARYGDQPVPHLTVTAGSG